MTKQLKDERLYVRLSKEEKIKLSEIAKKECRTMSSLVHLMIAEKIENYEK